MVVELENHVSRLVEFEREQRSLISIQKFMN